MCIPHQPRRRAGISCFRVFQRAAWVILCLLGVAQLRATSVTVGFEDIGVLTSQGWTFTNNSAPQDALSSPWFQGNGGIFPAQAGAAGEYAAANFLSAQDPLFGGGAISNWLITPMFFVDNGVGISFWTRTEIIPALFPDRLEVRLSTSGLSSDVGGDPNSVGDFDTLLLTVNPGLDPDGYPDQWTRFGATLSGLPGPTNVRYAFRYFLPDNIDHANYIGLDNVEIEFVPEPSTHLLFGGGLALLSLIRWRQRRKC